MWGRQYKMKKISMFMAIFLVLFFAQASALMVSPAKIVVDYEPGATEQFVLTVSNNNDYDNIIEVSIEGEYNDYFEFSEEKVTLPANSNAEVGFTLTMPELEEFGTVKFDFVKLYVVPIQTGGVGATVALRVPIETDVPHPAKFIAINVEEAIIEEVGDQINLEATMEHLGTEVIDEVNGYFEISNAEGFNQKVNIETQTLFLPGSTEIANSLLDTTGMEEGRYNLSLHLDYDGESRDSDEVSLVIAKLEIDILDVTPKELNEGLINTVTLTLFNSWIEDLDADIEMSLEGTSTNAQSSYSLDALDEKDVSLSLDLSKVSAGDYILNANVAYEGEEVSESFDVVVNEYKGTSGSDNTVLIAIIIIGGLVLIAIIILIIVVLRKRT